MHDGELGETPGQSFQTSYRTISNNEYGDRGMSDYDRMRARKAGFIRGAEYSGLARGGRSGSRGYASNFRKFDKHSKYVYIL